MNLLEHCRRSLSWELSLNEFFCCEYENVQQSLSVNCKNELKRLVGLDFIAAIFVFVMTQYGHPKACGKKRTIFPSYYLLLLNAPESFGICHDQWQNAILRFIMVLKINPKTDFEMFNYRHRSNFLLILVALCEMVSSECNTQTNYLTIIDSSI